VVAFIPPLSLSNVCSNRVGHGTGLVRPQHTEGLRETPVDVYGVLDWLAISARDLLTPEIGPAMVRMQHAVFVDRDGSNACRWAALGDLLGYL
jgi:hypothetical protein